MIEFHGVLPDECQKFKIKAVKKSDTLLTVIYAVVFTVSAAITAVCGILKTDDFVEWLTITITLLIISIMLPISYIIGNKRFSNFNPEIRITIENGQITNGNTFNTVTKPLSKVKKVIDCGDWYAIVFKFGGLSNSWICHKALLVQGTIDEFEKLFDGKLKKS